MTKALTLDEARESALDEYGPRWLRVAEALARAVTEAVLAEHETARRKRLDDLKRGVGIPVYDDMVECEHCHGIGQPGGKMGGPELGFCSWCGGLGRVARQEIAALSDGDRTRAEDAQVAGGTERTDQRDLYVRIAEVINPDRVVPVDIKVTAKLVKLINEMEAALRSRDATIADLERRLAESRQSGVDWERAGAAWRKRVEEQVERASLAERERDALRAQLDEKDRELAALKHDIERHIAIAAEHATEAGRSALSQSKEG